MALYAAGDCAAASITYTYDPSGRLTTALYDNGLCIAYAYDANGNRTSVSGVVGGAPQTAVWGTGAWGCFNWTSAGGAQLRRLKVVKRGGQRQAPRARTHGSSTPD